MRKIHGLELAGLVIAALTLGSGCPNVPKLEDKVVELAAGGSTSVIVEAQGEVNVHDATDTVNVKQQLDLAKIVHDAGIDVTDLKDVRVAGVSYRVTRTDPTPNRRIVNGVITVRRVGGAEVQLVTNFNVDVNGATGYQTATLDPAGVAVLNGLLADLLAEVRDGIPATNTDVIYHVTGQSTPSGIATNFQYEIKLDVTILGTVKVKVLG